MNSTTIECATCPFGWLLADTDAGPLALVRLGDIPSKLAIVRGVSALRALEMMCDGLRQLDGVQTHGYWWAFPEQSGERLLDHRDLLERGLELFELRNGFARQVRDEPGPLESERWAPGDPVPWGYEMRSGARPSSWAAFAGDEVSHHIVWMQPWPEPRQGFAHSWIDRLNLPERWEHLIEAYGSVDVEGLTHGPGVFASQHGDGPLLSFLAMRRDVAELLWPDLQASGSADSATDTPGANVVPLRELSPRPEMPAYLSQRRPGDRWTVEQQSALLSFVEACTAHDPSVKVGALYEDLGRDLNCSVSNIKQQLAKARKASRGRGQVRRLA